MNQASDSGCIPMDVSCSKIRVVRNDLTTSSLESRLHTVLSGKREITSSGSIILFERSLAEARF
jgi:hypothetical protein